MKLNVECIRAILESVESVTTFNNPWNYEKGCDLIPGFQHEEIIYHVRQCSMSGLIIGFKQFGGGDIILVSDLSPLGHEFLANVRSDTVWGKVKEAAKTSSLPLLTELASALARAALGLP